MSAAADASFYVRQLASRDARARVRSLRSIAVEPIADRALLATCEGLLADREVCLVSIPYRFGEVRLVAAEAVAAIRALLGITEPVAIADAFRPLTTTQVGELARAAGIETQGGLDGVITTLRELVAQGRVPTRTVTR